MKMVRQPLASAVLLALLIAGCGGSGKGPAEAGVFRFRIPGDPVSLDPIHSVDLVSQTVVNNLFDPLVRLDAVSGEVAPCLARSWEPLDSAGLAYRFHLRTDMLFHNGRAVSAQDVRYSFERLLAPRSASERPWVLTPLLGAERFRAGAADRVEGIVPEDDSTLVLRLERPWAPFLAQLTMAGASIVPREEVERLGEEHFGQTPVGSGPFRFVGWQHDSWVRLERNERYARGVPGIRSLEFPVAPSVAVALEKFAAGELDLLEQIPPGQVELARRRFDGQLHIWPGLSVRYIGFNLSRAPFRGNRTLRLAFNYAVNKRAITEVLSEGVDQISTGPLPPGLPGWDPQAAGYPFSLERARELLAEAGYPGGCGLPELTLLYNNDPQDRRVCEFVQACLAELGVNVRLKSLEWAAFLAAIRAGESDLFRGSWIGDFPDAHNFLFTLFHSSNWGDAGNYTRYADSGVDSLLTLALRVTDPAQRAGLYREAERRIVADVPWIFTYHPGQVALVGPRWSGLTYPLVGIWAAELWRLQPVAPAAEGGAAQ
ncbi:ABC transporter substrate-binding protein [bacterium]|nr:ABC transporter substrate-binding protein [bacterium]